MAKKHKKNQKARRITKRNISVLLSRPSQFSCNFMNPTRGFRRFEDDSFMALCVSERRELTEWTNETEANEVADRHQKSHRFHKVTVKEK